MELGKLEVVPVRDVWAHEAHDFTPWLLGQADRLSDALGIDLELTAAEHPVGGYSLDLIGRDLNNDAVVIVENQLEATDHGHLGQILTYAAGTDASTIVWIATDFRDEHRQAIDWLNVRTDEETHFFGVRLSAVKIGESLPAPLFEVVAQPNDWQKRVRSTVAGGPLKGKRVFYEQFWTRYLERVGAEHPGWTRSKVPARDSWMTSPSGVRGVQIIPSFAAGGRLRHEMYIDTGDADANLELFEAMLAKQEVIETAYGAALEWQPIEGRRACRVAEYGTGSVENVELHDEYIDWLFDRGVRLRLAIAAFQAD